MPLLCYLCCTLPQLCSFVLFNCGNRIFGRAGKAISVDARAYTKSTSRALYLEAPCDRRELPADDQYPALRTTTSTTTELKPGPTRFVQLLHMSSEVLMATKDMRMIDKATMAMDRVPPIPQDIWTTTNLPCCQPLAPLQHSHSYTTTNSKPNGSRRGYVKANPIYASQILTIFRIGCPTQKRISRQCETR